MIRRPPTCMAALGLLGLASFAATAFAQSVALPDTPAGKLGGELIRHVNAGNPAVMRQWAPTVLSPAIAPADRLDVMQKLVEAVRDSGGVEVFDVRTDPRQPSLRSEERRVGK